VTTTVPRPEVLLFTKKKKKCYQWNRQISGTCSKWPPTVLCPSTVVVSPEPLSPTPLTSSAMKTPENTEKDPDNTEPADEGDIQIERSSD
jgi:hypothetical protein